MREIITLCKYDVVCWGVGIAKTGLVRERLERFEFMCCLTQVNTSALDLNESLRVSQVRRNAQDFYHVNQSARHTDLVPIVKRSV